MSSWTEVLLTATLLEDEAEEDMPSIFPAVEQVNEWLRERWLGELFLIANPDPTRHSPNTCFAAHCKSLNHEGFIDAVKSAPWRWKDQVQLFLREEDDEGFKEVPL